MASTEEGEEGVPSCSLKCNVHKHPFRWTDICNSLDIASIEYGDPTLAKHSISVQTITKINSS